MKRFFNALLCAGAAMGLLLSANVMAQQGPANGQAPATIKVRGQAPQGQKMGGVQALFTEAQRAELQTARQEQQKQANETKLLMAEKKARLNTLEAADKPDLKAINTVIDDISALQAKQMKAKAALDAKLRGMLTPEQRIAYDARQLQGRMGQGRGQQMRGQQMQGRMGQGRGMKMRGQQGRKGQGRGQGMRGQQGRKGQGRGQQMRGQQMQGRMGQGRGMNQMPGNMGRGGQMMMRGASQPPVKITPKAAPAATGTK